LKNSSVFYKGFYKFLRFFLIFVSFFCICEIGFSIDFRWASYDSEGWSGDWSDVYVDSGDTKTKHWEYYSEILPNLLGWSKCGGDFPGYGSVTDPDVYFTAENESYATLTADCTNELKNLFISDRKKSNEVFGSEKVTINLAGFELKTKNLVLGNSSFGTGDSVNFALTGGGTLMVSVAATFAAGCTYNIKIGANTVLDVADLTANVSGATINFSGAGTLKLGKATFSNCTVKFELGKIEISGAIESSDSATVNFNNVSSVSFSGEVKNSGTVNFSDCPSMKFDKGFANSGKVGFSGATATSVSGKITNSGTITLNQTAKTEFSGGFENQASGSLICNETAETIFAGDFTNSGKVTINGSSARTFSGNFANSGCLSICDSSKVVFQTVFSNSESGTVELLGKASSSVSFPADFDNKGTVFSSGLCLVVFSADITDSGTWIYSGGTVKNDGISYNILELNGTIVIPGDLTANEINTGNKIVLNEATTINATSVNLLQNTTFDLNSHKLVFGTEEKKCLVNSSSKKDIAFLGAGTGSEVNFYSANIGQDSNYIGNFYSESPVEFYCDVYANSVVVKSDVKIHSEKIFTSLGQEYFSSVTVSSAKTGIKANNGAISFKGNAIFEAESAVFASGAVSFGGTLTSNAGLLSIEGLETTFSGTFSSVAAEISARSGSVYFNDAVKFAGKTSVNALKGDVSFKTMLTASDNLSVNASKVIFFRDLTVSSGLVSLLANTIFSGDSTVSLENGTFSVGSESNPKMTTISAGASARFQNISVATFSGKIENSGNLSFSDCLSVEFGKGFVNSGKVGFSGNAESAVSGKITNGGTITLNQTAKTEFSGGFENQASGSLLCNETAESIFAGDFTNSGKVTINGGATRTFASFTNNQNGVISVNGTSNVLFDKFRNNNSSKLSVNDSAKIDFQTVFSNSESGTIKLLGNASSSVSFPASSDNRKSFENKGTIRSSGLCSVLFSADVTDSGTWIYSGGTVKNDGITYNVLELNGMVVIPGDLTAEEIIIKTESLNIQGEIKSSLIEVNTENKIVLDKNATINATSVNLLQSTTFGVNGKNLVFGAENQKSSIISENKKNLVILGSASDDKTIFYSSLGTATSPLGKISSKVEISFNADVYSESIEANSAAEISSAAITTSGGQGYNSTVKITGTQAKLVSENGGISFVGTVDISAETTISANDSVRFEGIFAATSAVSVEAKSVVFGSEVKTEARLDVSAIDGDVRFLSAVSGSSYGFSVTAANVQFDSDLVASGAVLLVAEAYFSGNAKDKVKIEAEKISVGSENIEKNLYISALKDENSAKKVEWNAPLNVSGSLLLLNADLSFGKTPSGGSPDISVSNDIVFLNGNSSSMYNDDILSKFEWRSGAKNIFKYQGTVLFPKNFPDGTEISSEKFISSLSGLGGITISAGKNFYCNGVNLEGDSGWNLKAGDNESSENFAVVYNSSIKNCSYSSSGNGISYFAAAEATDGGGNSENVCFGHPEISLARTIYDDVVEISFKDSISGKSLKIENSNNEIWKTFAKSSKFLTYENECKKISFAGTYIDAECTESTENKGDLEKFYLKAPETWNTDATGGTSGAAQSTDMNGNHRAAIPYLNIVRAVSDDFSGLFDEHKNRIANYDGEKRFVDVEDSCPPVLVAVRTGQELHQELPENQNPYDSHNFLEFQYSEEIFADKSDSSALNVQSSEKFGGMKNLSSESGFVVSGLVQFERGKISLGSESGLSAEKLNSIYRNFAVSLSKGESPQTHRFRISLAGYQSQTAAENSSGYPYWPGYIDSENTQMPSGKITIVPHGNQPSAENQKFNDFIKDSEGNSLLVKSQKNHSLKKLSVISDSSGDIYNPDWNDSVYGVWDLSAPVFAVYRSFNSNGTAKSSESYEVLGACKTSGTFLDRIEFHVFDNSEDEYFGGAKWFSQFGWGKDKNTLFAEDSYASDIFGGSRPFGNSPGGSARTSGGIRYSTLYNKSSYFNYGVDYETPASEFKNSRIESGAFSTLFLSKIGDKREISSGDSLYFSVFLKDGTKLPLKTNFSVRYDQQGCVTDLAGNLMRSAEVKSVDRVSPRFNMTSAKVSGNKLYVVFNKEINLEPVELEFSDGTKKSFGISDSLRFIKIPADGHKFEDSDVVSDLYIEKETAPLKTYSSATFTGLIFTLNRNVTLKDVKNYYIQSFSPESGKFIDPFTGIKDVKVTAITDVNGNYMSHGDAHALSDFAVDVVNPVYAYDDRFMEEKFGFSASAAAQSNLSVREWNEDQQKDGTLLTEHNLFVVTSQDSGNSEDAESLPEKIIMYYDKSPDSDSVSKEYNKNLEQNLRVWIPSLVPVDTSGSSTEISPLTALAPATNSNNLFAAGEVSKNIAKFTLDWETMEKNGYSSGNQVSFLFGLAEPDGSPVKICHAPAYDEITGVYRLEPQPLFALRLKNSNDPVSLDLWSFRLKSAVLQRGNVTIFNNVIDVNKGEMSVVHVNMPSEGRLDVIVMTLDGNIIRYLQHGTASAGEHNYSWNGTSKSGKKVARGLYFVRVFGNGIDETRKIMVVKN